MSVRYLLDTNICIYIRRKRPPEVLERFRKARPGTVAISVVTWGELLVGAEKNLQREAALSRLQDFVAGVLILPMPTDAGLRYGTIRASLERKDTLIGNNDLWIASHALAEELILVTNNEREFSRVPGLVIENWVR
jgi:tRNA(fMet)-specific endonuclease VapC